MPFTVEPSLGFAGFVCLGIFVVVVGFWVFPDWRSSSSSFFDMVYDFWAYVAVIILELKTRLASDRPVSASQLLGWKSCPTTLHLNVLLGFSFMVSRSPGWPHYVAEDELLPCPSHWYVLPATLGLLFEPLLVALSPHAKLSASAVAVHIWCGTPTHPA